MNWGTSVSVATICYTSHLIAIKFLGDKLPSSAVTPTFYIFAMMTLCAVFFIEKPRVELGALTSLSTIIPIVIAGVTIALTDYFFVKTLNLEVPISVALPLFLGVGTILTCLFSYVLFKEQFTLTKALGILLTISGIFLINKK